MNKQVDTSEFFEIKKGFKGFIRRLVNRFSVIRNQMQISKLAKSESIILLRPQPPVRCGGTVDRYYHFLFDLILPLYCLLNKVSPNVVFLVEDFGNFTDQLLQIFPQQIKLIENAEEHEKVTKMPLLGMNPKCVALNNGTVASFRKEIFSRLGTNIQQTPNKVLLIERLPPDDYFFTKAKIQGGGASWRSIRNHAELHSVIASLVKAPYEFHNLQLETLSLEKQADYFNQASVVIAQHGAGLTNCIWMKEKTILVELRHNEMANHYRMVSKLRRLKYFRHKTDSSHATVEIDVFSNWLVKTPELAQYFSR